MAKHFHGEPGQVQSGVQVPVDHQPTSMALIGAVFERHAFLDMPAARTAFGRRKPARGDEEISPSGGDLGLQELQQLPQRGIGNGSGELPIGHHPQDVEVFDANDSTGACQFGAELVLPISANSGNLLMLARYLEPLFLIILAEHGPLGFRVFRLLFLTKFALQLAEFLEMER